MIFDKKLMLMFVILFTTINFFSQPGLPSGPNCWPPPCIPIDGGISIFTFLSILFGYKFLSNKN